MLVCNVSMRPPGRAIAADVAEAALADDASTIGQVVFATLVDDPASVADIVDAYLGEVMLEAATATDSFDAGYALATVINEAVTATSSQDGTVTAAPAGTTWNPADKSAGISLSGGNLISTSSAASTVVSVRATKAINSSKAYFEITRSPTGFVDNFMGIVPSTKPLTESSGAGAAVVNGWGGNIFINSTSSIANIGDFATGDVLCVALDMANKRIWFRRNNGSWNGSGSADPATNTGGFDVSAVFTSVPAYPWSQYSNTGVNNTLNAGASAFAQTIPSGFVAWNSAS